MSDTFSMSETGSAGVPGSTGLSALPPEVTLSPPSAADRTRDYEFSFTGSGGEFFRIWIVNVLLTIVTLGIYSAWAKVRTNRYIYGNTSVAGGHFDYHADPLVILRGRIIALVLLGLFALGQNFFPILVPAMMILLFVALPWIAIRALAFAARNTSWKNVRFNFIGKPAPAFGAYVGWNLVGMITFGLGVPYAWYKTSKFGVDNHRLGLTQFKLMATPADFYRILVVLVLASFAMAILFAFLAPMLIEFAATASESESGFGLELVSIATYFLVYLGGYNLYTALRFQTIYNDLRLGDNRINTDMLIADYLWIAISNSLAMLFTLGFFYPWAKVRMTEFLVESLELQASDIDSFVAAAETEESAFGEEFGDAFDLGIGV